jgi:hypothetical protein
MEGPNNDEKIEYANDMFDFTELTSDEQLLVSRRLFQGDVDPKYVENRVAIETAQEWGRVAYNRQIGTKPFERCDDAIFGDINDYYSVLLVHDPFPDGGRNENGDSIHVLNHRIELQGNETSEYSSSLIQQMLRCNARDDFDKIVGKQMDIIRTRKDTIIHNALNNALRTTKKHYDSLLTVTELKNNQFKSILEKEGIEITDEVFEQITSSLSSKMVDPKFKDLEEMYKDIRVSFKSKDNGIEPRILGNGALEFESQPMVTDFIVKGPQRGPAEAGGEKMERYHLYCYNLRNQKKLGWKQTRFAISGPTNAAPALCLNTSKNECVIAVYADSEGKRINVYRVPMYKIKENITPTQVILPKPFYVEPICDDNGKEIEYRDLSRLYPLFCKASESGEQIVVGYGDGVFVLDDLEPTHVFHHRIKPPASMFNQMVTSAAFGIKEHNLLFIGTRAGQIWMVDYTKMSPTKFNRPSYIFAMILPVRQINYTPHFGNVNAKGKLTAMTVSEVAFLDGPVINVRTADHVGRAINVDRPMAITMRGALIYILSKAGGVCMVNIDPQADLPPVNEQTGEQEGMIFPSTRTSCQSYWLTPWYGGIYASPDRVFILYPDGLIRVWFAVELQQQKK